MGPEETDRIQTQLESTNKHIEVIEADVGAIKTCIALLQQQSSHSVEYCPMRVDIARATDGAASALAKADVAYEMARTNEVTLAKLGVAAGGGGAFGALLFAVASRLLGAA